MKIFSIGVSMCRSYGYGKSSKSIRVRRASSKPFGASDTSLRCQQSRSRSDKFTVRTAFEFSKFGLYPHLERIDAESPRQLETARRRPSLCATNGGVQ